MPDVRVPFAKTPLTYGAIFLAQNWLRSEVGKSGLLRLIVTAWLNEPDGAMIVLTVFFENSARV